MYCVSRKRGRMHSSTDAFIDAFIGVNTICSFSSKSSCSSGIQRKIPYHHTRHLPRLDLGQGRFKHQNRKHKCTPQWPQSRGERCWTIKSTSYTAFNAYSFLYWFLSWVSTASLNSTCTAWIGMANGFGSHLKLFWTTRFTALSATTFFISKACFCMYGI